VRKADFFAPKNFQKGHFTMTKGRIQLKNIHLAKYNPRKISKEALGKLKASIKSYTDALPGWDSKKGFRLVAPVIVNKVNWRLVGGHQRILALGELGQDWVMEEDVRFVNVPNERKEMALNVMLNNADAAGEWDFPLLKDLLAEIDVGDFRVDDYTGFDEDAIKEMFDFDGSGESGKDTEPEEPPKKARTKPGDLYELGKHRLLCGDSTKKEDVEMVMAGEKAILCVTDPPYGIQYDANWRNEADRANGKPYGDRAIGKVTNDDCADWSQAWANFTGDVIYSWHPAGAHGLIHGSALQVSGFEIRVVIIWAKNQFPIGRGHYHGKHEPCYYAVKKGSTAKWIGDHSQTTLWEIDKPRKSETGHSTQKPLECMARPIRNHKSEIVYDPFLGSGTTLIAAENLDRKCYGLEISPAYCDVIVERYCQHVNNRKIKLNGKSINWKAFK